MDTKTQNGSQRSRLLRLSGIILTLTPRIVTHAITLWTVVLAQKILGACDCASLCCATTCHLSIIAEICTRQNCCYVTVHPSVWYGYTGDVCKTGKFALVRCCECTRTVTKLFVLNSIIQKFAGKISSIHTCCITRSRTRILDKSAHYVQLLVLQINTCFAQRRMCMYVRLCLHGVEMYVLFPDVQNCCPKKMLCHIQSTIQVEILLQTTHALCCAR